MKSVYLIDIWQFKFIVSSRQYFLCLAPRVVFQQQYPYDSQRPSTLIGRIRDTHHEILRKPMDLAERYHEILVSEILAKQPFKSHLYLYFMMCS